MLNLNLPKKTVFIDESGNNGFEFSKDNVSSHYIATAIVVDTDKLDQIRQKAEVIRKEFFQNGEMKSEYCKNDGRRFNIICKLSELDIIISSVIIDKKKIYDDSPIKEFANKVFYPYLNKKLYLELKVFDTDMAIFADEYKDREFMNRFKKYIEPLFKRTLIDNNSFDFVKSKNEVLIQVADFIAGTLAFGYEEDKKGAEYKGYFEVLRNRLRIKHWPTLSISEELELIDNYKYDPVVAQNSIRLAKIYIEKNQIKDDEIIIDQLLTLNYLLHEIYIGNSDKYIYSKQLIKYIKNRTGRSYEDHLFYTKIIAGMRDGGVIIAGSNSGYKIPLTVSELVLFSDHTLSNIIPRLDRLESVRNKFLKLTNHELDILDSSKYKRIKDYMDKAPN